jgi:putative tryptophan/tyrosine transport system substrate-binding protein
MRRRDFIAGLCAAVWPLLARAQQDGRVRRIGWLINGAENDPGNQAQQTALRDELAKLGWSEGRNLQIDLRFTTNNPMRAFATEMIAHAPDVIITNGGPMTRVVQQETQAIPIVYVVGPDPVATGLLRNMARPEGNTTGFSNFEPSIGGKWMELLKEAAPSLSRIAVIFNAIFVPSIYVPFVEAAARSHGVEIIKTAFRNGEDIVRAINAVAAEPNGGLLVLPPDPSGTLRKTMLQAAAQHRLPAIYPSLEDAAAGGLLAYTPDRVELYRRAASYVDRLLRGARVNELPVQFPTKFELIVNLKTAKAIGLTIPETFLVRADTAIE